MEFFNKSLGRVNTFMIQNVSNHGSSETMYAN